MMKIDLVIPWVDGNDPRWQAEKQKYQKHRTVNDGYYQDWGWMRYWFRCVEANMPWINRIFFITYGHVPEWLNIDHPKLRVVKHEEFMPQEFLPTFNSCTISMNVHRISGLSEHFIYAEDDIFFIGEQEREDFFSEGGLPKDYFWIKPITEQFSGDFAYIMMNNILTLKKYFRLDNVAINHTDICDTAVYPAEVVEDNRRYQGLKYVPGFQESHMAYSFLKSTFEEVWEKEEMNLYVSSRHRFRTISDYTVSLMKGWQLLTGKYEPFFPKHRYFTDTADPGLETLIMGEETSMICINESTDSGYSSQRAKEICSFFEKRFPEKSRFEI